jgi:hypothetical protein
MSDTLSGREAERSVFGALLEEARGTSASVVLRGEAGRASRPWSKRSAPAREVCASCRVGGRKPVVCFASSRVLRVGARMVPLRVPRPLRVVRALVARARQSTSVRPTAPEQDPPKAVQPASPSRSLFEGRCCDRFAIARSRPTRRIRDSAQGTEELNEGSERRPVRGFVPQQVRRPEAGHPGLEPGIAGGDSRPRRATRPRLGKSPGAGIPHDRKTIANGCRLARRVRSARPVGRALAPRLAVPASVLQVIRAHRIGRAPGPGLPGPLANG